MNGNFHNTSKRKSSVDFITETEPGLTQTGQARSSNGSSLFITQFCKQIFWNGKQRKAFLDVSIIVSFPVLSKHEKDNVKINGNKTRPTCQIVLESHISWNRSHQKLTSSQLHEVKLNK